MRDVQKLRDLLEQVSAASGPDKEIDAQIMGLTYRRGQRSIGTHEDSGPNGSWVPVKSDVWIDPVTDKWVSTHARDFTASLDASIALVDRMLPSIAWSVTRGPDNDGRDIVTTSILNDAGYLAQNSIGCTAPLSILSALLRALISQAEGEGA